MSRTISAGGAPKILIENVGGDLSLVGWEGQEILIKGNDEEIRVQQDGEKVSLSCGDDLSLRVPHGSTVLVQAVGGDAAIRGVTGNIELKEANGDLSIRDAGSVTIDTVRADFSLRGAKGNLNVKNALTEVSIRGVEGGVTLQSVADDLALRDVRGNILANVGDDVVMYLTPQAGNSYNVTAGDDILLVLPTKVDATLTLNGDEIFVDWPGIKNDEEVTGRVVVLGNGDAQITLKAGGNVRVSNQVDAADSAEEFGNFAGMNFDWSNFGRDFDDRISKRVNEAARRAQKKIEEAAKRIERQTQRAEQRSFRFKGGAEIGRSNWGLGSRGVPLPPKEPVSDEERMSILRMLQEKKITAEEAEKLLAALDGGL